MKRVALPSVWGVFCEQWKPDADFGPNDASGIRSLLREHGRNLSCCEWRPSCYTFVACVQQYHGRCFVREPDHAEVRKKMGDCAEWNGQHLDVSRWLVWADMELNDFAHAVNHLCPTVDVAIIPHVSLILPLAPENGPSARW